MKMTAKANLITDEQYAELRKTLNRANGLMVVIGSGFKMDETHLLYSKNPELNQLHSRDKTIQRGRWEKILKTTNRPETHPFLLAYPAWMRTSPLPLSIRPFFHIFKSSVMDVVSGVTGENIDLFELNGNIAVGMGVESNIEQKVTCVEDLQTVHPMFPFQDEEYHCKKKNVGRFELLCDDLNVNNFFFLGCTSKSEIHASFFNRALLKTQRDRVSLVTANTNKNNFMIGNSTLGVCCDAKQFLDELHERLLNDHPEMHDSYRNVCKFMGLCS